MAAVTSARSMIGYWHDTYVVCLSICPSACLWRCAKKRYILPHKCLNRWIGSTLLGTTLYNIQFPKRPYRPNFPTAKFQNLPIWNSCGEYTYHGYSRQRSVATSCEEECTRCVA